MNNFNWSSFKYDAQFTVQSVKYTFILLNKVHHNINIESGVSVNLRE